MSKARDLADFISTGSILSDGTIESTEISGVTATANEINTLDGITATTEELNNVAGVNSDVQTQLDGKQDVVSGVSDTEIGYLDGVTSNLQTQLDNISVTSGSLTKSFASGETASITLAQAISPAPVVSVTKEVPQTGQSSKGAWDVATDGANYDRHNTAYDTTLTPSVVFAFSSMTYDSLFFSAVAQESNPQSLSFNNDGTKMYVLGYSNNTIYQYSLSTSYNVGTASYDSVSFNAASQDASPVAITFNGDGTKLYILGNANDAVYQYSLSTAYNVGTASYDSVSFSVASQDTSPLDMVFNTDGTKLYVVGANSDNVYQYTLSTAYDISTASYDSISLDLSGTTNTTTGTMENPIGVAFASSGSLLYILNYDNTAVFKYDLTTAYDLSTASYSGDFFSVGSQESQSRDVTINNDGTKLYVIGSGSDSVHQYSIPTSEALVLGSGSFASTDVGKTIEGNGGEVILTATDGAYSVVTAFNDSSTIASGSWDMYALTFDATNGVELPNTVVTAATGYEYTNPTYDGKFTNVTVPSAMEDLYLTPDGTKLFVSDASQVNVYNLSTAYDVSSAVYLETHTYGSGVFFGGQSGATKGIDFSPNGLHFIYGENSNGNIWKYTLSTAFDLTTASYNTNANVGLSEGVKYFNDGNSVIVDKGTESQRYDASSPYQISNLSYAAQIISHTSNVYGSSVSTDGVYAYTAYDNGNTVKVYELSTPNNLNSASLIKTIDTSAVGGSLTGVVTSSDGLKLYITDRQPNGIHVYETGTAEVTAQPTAQYSPAITNASGQIDTGFWTDINSMTADQTANDGEVYYAVSTDDRTTWSVIKDSDGVRPIVRDNAGTWEYNEAVITSNYDVASLSYDDKSFDNSAYDGGGSRGFNISGDGTKVYYCEIDNNRVYQYELSTPWDISTATPSGSANTNYLSLNLPYDIHFNADGTKAFILGRSYLRTHTLSSAYDITTSTGSTTWTGFTSEEPTPSLMTFNGDGTKVYIAGDQDKSFQYSLSTPYDVSTATYDSVFINHRDATSGVNNNFLGITFNGDGTKFYGVESGEANLYEFTLSTAYDASTASYSTVYDLGYVDQRGLAFSASGDKLYTLNFKTMRQYSSVGEAYTTSTTWTAATSNTEMDALQEALTEVSVNRMDKTQLDAVTDPNHYTLGDSLDLMIALYIGSNGTSPTSDGVSINYDAQALNQGAVLGTDYDYDFPDSTTVRVTSNAAQNLKIRVV